MGSSCCKQKPRKSPQIVTQVQPEVNDVFVLNPVPSKQNNVSQERIYQINTKIETSQQQQQQKISNGQNITNDQKTSQKNINNTNFSNESQPQPPDIQRKFREEEIKVMLLGQGGVGKKRLLTSLGEEVIDLEDFKESRYEYKKQQFCIVGAPDFEMEDDIDVREHRITQFQKYFDKCKKLQAMMILVNFERTDLMKKKIMSVFKFMRKFQNKMLLAVTQFDLSENQDEDQNHLKEKLKHFINDERMIFLAKEDNAEVIKKKIYDKTCVLLDKEATNFDKELDFKDTLFEKVDEQEQIKMMNDLNQAIGQNRSK